MRASLPAAPVGPETLLRHWQLVVALCRAITLLPGEYREVLVLVDVEGLRDEQVAWLLALGEAKTRERLQRARMLVRETLLSGRAA